MQVLYLKLSYLAVQVLEELMSSHDDDLEYYKIPSLGKHYSQRWLAEDTEQESKDSKSIQNPHETHLPS